MKANDQKPRILLLALLFLCVPAHAAKMDCSKLAGVAKARCDRHDEMFKKCGPVKGDAHYVCDREFFLANPLKCDALSGNDAVRCKKEVDAFKACEASPGKEFARCVRKATGENPAGH